jgi:periplasmic protein TonB
MNQWIGAAAGPELDEVYRSQPWRRFALTGPLAAATILAMLLGARFLKPNLPPPPPHNAIEAQLVEVLPPPKPAGLQGGAAPAPVKPKPAEKPHPEHKTVAHHPKVEAPPIISPSETSEVGEGPSVPTTSGPPSKGEAVGIPGGTGVGSGAGIGNDSGGARAIYAPTPIIPDDMRENIFQAVAIAHFKVGPDGTVDVTLAQPTPNPRLNQILLNTLREWKFFPAMKDGIAINSEFDVRIPITVQ